MDNSRTIGMVVENIKFKIIRRLSNSKTLNKPNAGNDKFGIKIFTKLMRQENFKFDFFVHKNTLLVYLST